MARKERRWERLLDQLREEFERLEDQLDDLADIADLAAEQEAEILTLQEKIEDLADELERRDDDEPA